MALLYPPVQLTETVVSAGAPNVLQQTVAYVSFGATNLPVGTRQLVTALTNISANLSANSWLTPALTTFYAQGSAPLYVIELGTVGTNIQAVGTATLETTPEYTVATIAVDAGGSGWTAGETFSFPGGMGTVETVSGGAAATITLDTSPAQATNPAGAGIAATATSGSGTGLTLTVTSSTTQVPNGSVGSVTVTTAGQGYASIPAVTLMGGGGTGATAVATVANGQVTAITVTAAGSGYTSAPTVTIGAPPASLPDLLAAYIADNPLQNYLYVIGAADSQAPAWTTFAGNYDANTGLTYFLLTLDAAAATAFPAHKSVILFTPSTSAASTEFGASTIAYMLASMTPSATARIRPFNYRFVTGVTEYAAAGSSAISALVNSNTNIVIPATAGGLTNDMLLGGQCSDGNAINLWYGADYAALNVTQGLANALIEGANNAANPLDYDQDGVNRLVAQAISTLNSCVTVGAIIGPVTVSSIDFATYVAANPGAYQAGTYNGISFSIVPARGFSQITYAMTVDFTAATVAATAQ